MIITRHLAHEVHKLLALLKFTVIYVRIHLNPYKRNTLPAIQENSSVTGLVLDREILFFLSLWLCRLRYQNATIYDFSPFSPKSGEWQRWTNFSHVILFKFTVVI